MLERDGDRWHAVAATGEDTLGMPEIGIDVPLMEFYVGLDFGGTETPSDGNTDPVF